MSNDVPDDYDEDAGDGRQMEMEGAEEDVVVILDYEEIEKMNYLELRAAMRDRKLKLSRWQEEKKTSKKLSKVEMKKALCAYHGVEEPEDEEGDEKVPPDDYDKMNHAELIAAMRERKLSYKLKEMKKALPGYRGVKEPEDKEPEDEDAEDEEEDEKVTAQNYENLNQRELIAAMRERKLSCYITGKNGKKQLSVAELRKALRAYEGIEEPGDEDKVPAQDYENMNWRELYVAMRDRKLMNRPGGKQLTGAESRKALRAYDGVEAPGKKAPLDYGKMGRIGLQRAMKDRHLKYTNARKPFTVAEMLNALRAYDGVEAPLDYENTRITSPVQQKKIPPAELRKALRAYDGVEEPEDEQLPDASTKDPPYQPGPNSHRFLARPFYRAVSAKRLYPWCAMTAVMLNDALNEHADELEIDGLFLVTPNGSAGLTKFPGEPWWYGPQVVFAFYTRSKQDRERWRLSTLAEKTSLSSLTINAWQLADKHAVHPIWMSWQAPLFVRKSRRKTRFVPFAPVSSFPRYRRDPTTVSNKNFSGTPGIFVDIVNARFICSSAEAAKNVSLGVHIPKPVNRQFGSKYPALAVMNFGEQLYADYLIDSLVELNEEKGNDPTIELIKAIARQVVQNPEQTITLRRARAWAVISSRKLKPAAKVVVRVKKRRQRRRAVVAISEEE